MKFNEDHYKQVFDSNIYKDKTWKELWNHEMRNKILSGNFDRNNYNNSEVCKFLQLLK